MHLLRKFAPYLRKGMRYYRTDSELIQTTLDENTGVTTVTMKRPPVNSLNFELLQDLQDTFRDLEHKRSKGMILTSGMPNVFTAGLDLMEFYKPDLERLEMFWKTLQKTWLALYTSAYPTVALINGHSPAGGCLLAMSCEYRVMVGHKYTIGLNEAKIGIPAPIWFMDTMRNTIGHRQAELALFSGVLYTADEALSIGLVDAVAEDNAQALDLVNAYFKKQHSTDLFTRSFMKKNFRQDIVDKFEKGREDDVQLVILGCSTPKTQERLEKYLESIKKKQ